MDQIYKGKYLEIKLNKTKSIFHQSWFCVNEINKIEFRNEMLAYALMYKKYKPKFTIWDQTNFSLELTPTDYEWIEINVNIPCKEYGNEKCAFIVGKEVLAHISVMDSFTEVQSCIQPQHFGSLQNAEKWIYEDDVNFEELLEVSFEGQNENGKNIFKIISDSTHIIPVLKNVKSLMNKQEFFKQNRNKFLSLTKREIEILNFYCEGKSLNEIALDNHISLFTARTHWRNLKKKLGIVNSSDIHKYHSVFIH